MKTKYVGYGRNLSPRAVRHEFALSENEVTALTGHLWSHHSGASWELELYIGEAVRVWYFTALPQIRDIAIAFMAGIIWCDEQFRCKNRWCDEANG